MIDRDHIEQGNPGPWQQFEAFHVPPCSSPSMSDRAAFSEYYAHLATHLSDTSSEFIFEPTGTLLVRTRDDREDVGRIHTSASSIHDKICRVLGDLGLGQPPAFAETESCAHPPLVVNDRQGGLRRRLARVFPRLLLVVEGTTASDASYGAALADRYEKQQAHGRAELRRLQEWIESQVRQGVWLPAVRAWASRRRGSATDPHPGGA